MAQPGGTARVLDLGPRWAELRPSLIAAPPSHQLRPAPPAKPLPELKPKQVRASPSYTCAPRWWQGLRGQCLRFLCVKPLASLWS